jgi:hypothetical protein
MVFTNVFMVIGITHILYYSAVIVKGPPGVSNTTDNHCFLHICLKPPHVWTYNAHRFDSAVEEVVCARAVSLKTGCDIHQRQGLYPTLGEREDK